MHGLSGIIAANNNAVARAKARAQAETETSRHCSFADADDGAVVLHSAKQRATVFLDGKKAVAFKARWFGTNSAEVRDSVVESYFQHSRRV